MPLTKTQLLSRWKTPAGKNAVRAITDALRAGTSTAALAQIVSGLPGTEEFPSTADLRGIALPELIAAATSDLSEARFEHAKLSWNFGGSVLRGAVFDRAEGRNTDFGGCDLTGSSFQNANLPGAVFFGARLNDANLAGLKMRSGQLKAADCRGAIFAGADLRMVWAAETDFRGANLTDANLVGASLGQLRWDEHTQCSGAQLSREGAPAAFAAAALAQGATLRSEKPDWELSLLDATRVALQSEDRAGSLASLLERLARLRDEVARDAEFPWGNALREGLTPEQRLVVDRAVRTAATNLGALLGSK